MSSLEQVTQQPVAISRDRSRAIFGQTMGLVALTCLVAGIGVIRLNDVFARMHAATKAGTLGLALICIAVMVQS